MQSSRLLADNFNPRSPHGERLKQMDRTYTDIIFQSTLPARGATNGSGVSCWRTLFQSTLPARGATVTGLMPLSEAKFQSTLPARGATQLPWRLRGACCHFNPRSPHGERRSAFAQPSRGQSISIHAPRTGSDSWDYISEAYSVYISIHAPRTGSDRSKCRNFAVMSCISIHAPRTGSDLPLITLYIHFAYFNPRSPHGERQFDAYVVYGDIIFQSTLPARGATSRAALVASCAGFQSTLPARGATRALGLGDLIVEFQSTLPARGATRRAS